MRFSLLLSFNRGGAVSVCVLFAVVTAPSAAAEVIDFRVDFGSKSAARFVMSPERTGRRTISAPPDVPAAPISAREGQGGAVHIAMLQDFNAALEVSAPTSGSQFAPAVRYPSGPSFIRVPVWMRVRSATTSSVGFTPQSASPFCSSDAYVPSGLLKSKGEARRRLLYPYVLQEACRSGVPIGLLDALIIQESGYDPAARSRVGAYGLGQLMPGTARDLGVNSYKITDNLRGAALYLRMQLNEFGSPHLALAAYNAGPHRVRRSQGVPNIAETRGYVTSVLKNWSHLLKRRLWI